MNKQLQDALDVAIRDNTFNLSAVESIKAMRDENERLHLEVERLGLHNKELITANTQFSLKCNEYASEANNIKEREASVAKREISITQLECAVNKEIAVANAYKDCFGLVFRNQVVSSTTLGHVPVQGGNGGSGYVQQATTTEQTTVS